MEWIQESVIELIEFSKRKETTWDPKHPVHFNNSDYNLILNFFHEPQITIFVLPVRKPSVFNKSSHTSGTLQLTACWKFGIRAAG